jgi:two-component system, chemotaxis family, protein-glutamate methylesterase/glutaminase
LSGTPASRIDAAVKPGSQIRVMIVDDSAAIRGFLARWIESDPLLKVVATANNGRMAIDQVKSVDPDVILLDIEMPEMDGITALPHLLKASPQSKIIMASALTRHNAEVSLKALALGATDYVPKPSSLAGSGAGDEFRRELCAKIAAVAKPRARKMGAQLAAATAPQTTAPIKLRPSSMTSPQIVAIGSSTGGPQALVKVITGIAPQLEVPVVITQHMPATFTAILAETLGRSSGLKCMEGADGMKLQPGHVYVAPGDNHMTIKGRGGPIALLQTPPENFCRPAVDPMFRSVAAAYGSGVLAVVLTGMGADGREGARAVAGAGGTILAQDEASSVVWGMPAAVAHAGLASAVLPLDSVAGEVRKYLGLKRR